MARLLLLCLIALAPAAAPAAAAGQAATSGSDPKAAEHKKARAPAVEAPAAKTHEKAHAAAKPAPRVAAKPKPAPAPLAPESPAPEEPQAPADQAKGSVTGLPLPRFAALRTDEVNMRAGPGTRYPIDWVYKRHDLPVEIEREFEVWRLVRDPDGVKGWVHQATLVGRRDFMVVGDERAMRQNPDDAAPPVARLKPGVIGHIRSCDATEWCEVQVQDYRGYLKRSEFWGAYTAEVVGG
jgi:SH3-like domain-containing protein